MYYTSSSLLGYGEPQILECLKTLPTKLYWILFPIEDLKQAVETAKRILTKDKIDRQLSGQSSSTPFMSIKDNYSWRVSSDTKEELRDKIHKLTVMIGKLALQIADQLYNLNHKFTKAELEDKIEIIMIDTIIISKVIRIDIGQMVKIGDSIDRIEVGLGMNKIIREAILEVTQGILTDKIVEESIEIITEMKVMIEAEMGTGPEKGHFPETLVAIEIGVQAIVGQVQD